VKQFAISTSFNYSLLANAFAVGALVSGCCAIAQNSSLDLVVNVPFDFRSGSESMPAGQYEIRELSDHYLLIRKSDQPRAQILPASIAEAPSLPDHSSLVFHRYGNQYFLHQIWLRGQAEGFKCRTSHAEREILRAAKNPPPTKSGLALNKIPRQ
jgi:hypothetical protein